MEINMKKMKYILWIFVLATITLSCTENDLADIQASKQDSESNIKLNFNITSATDVSISRATNEIPIKDLRVFIFDNNGDLMTEEVPFFDSNTVNNGINGGLKEVTYPTTGEEIYSGWVRITLKEGYSKEDEARILMLANTSAENMGDIYELSTLNDISKIKTIDNLLSYICEYKETVARPNNDRLMITGTYNTWETAVEKESDILAFPLNYWENIPINMYRMDAKINFNVTAANGCIFTLNSYQVYNVPKKAYLFWKYYLQQGGEVNHAYPLFNKDASKDNDDFFTTEEIEVNAIAGPSSPASFNFYMPENLKEPENFSSWKDETGEVTEKAKLAHREANEIVDNKHLFTNAPDKGTYVILRGAYEGTTTINGEPKKVKANVSYIIHLGFRSVSNDPSNFKGGTNDYLTKRNFLYTYNVRVNGINDIVTEVIQGGGKMPAAEGEITIEEESITLSNSSASTITVYKGETLSTESTENWLKVNGQTIESIKFSEKQEYPLTAETLPEGTTSRKITILGTRTSTNGQSKIIRKITVTQNP